MSKIKFDLQEKGHNSINFLDLQQISKNKEFGISTKLMFENTITPVFLNNPLKLN